MHKGFINRFGGRKINEDDIGGKKIYYTISARTEVQNALTSNFISYRYFMLKHSPTEKALPEIILVRKIWA